MTVTARRATIFALLAALMAATRLHHFAAIPDASWAVFFIGGFYLASWQRWAFPALMVLAVAVDWFVISSQGLSFWQHYCVSPAYWCLVPAYFALWAGGSLLRRHLSTSAPIAIGQLVVALVASVTICHLLAQGSFYWISASVADPTLAGWWKNYSDWLLPYMRTAALYVGVAAMAHVLLTRVLPKPATAVRPLHAD
ncbi:hypothetical protein [Luteimonas sp. 3794]|uniref:hypothetical protein n=1 Tax=Luteimonas sp. 3794 TaxID=2817730 RepID=UPI0028601827|nr:hypothetical protein [Luteimonas sp. 3794]MDR6991278.1 cellulose synthase/poly-beta-1,6-N-acetylglucosamine synthase-like glycosyltransferase [Luteimonas sp. 3794]